MAEGLQFPLGASGRRRRLRAGVCEPRHAQALRELQHQPERFDLSDRTIVLLGARSETGPLAWLAQWRASLLAIDLPKPAVWNRIARQVGAGNAALTAPPAVADPRAPLAWVAAPTDHVAPSTNNATMAALWVHDLRRPRTTAPEKPTGHPLALVAGGALHGGVWRMPYLPQSVLPFAALSGFMKRR